MRMKPTSARLAILFAIALIGCAVLVMRTGVFGGKQTDYRNATKRPRRERLDTATLPHSTPSKMTGRTYIRRNIPVLGLAHTIFVDDTTGKLEVVGSRQLRTDGTYDIKLEDNMLASFAGILIDLPGHGFVFLDRETCKKPDVDIQLAFADIPDFNLKDGSLALLVDGLFPLDLTPLIAKWTPVLQQRLGAIPGTTLLATTTDKKGCYYQTGLTSGQLRKISGRVTDVKGKPIAANVSIWMGKNITGPAYLNVASSADGTFNFKVDSAASVSISVWDPVRRLVSEPTYIAGDTVMLVAKPAGLADVIVQEGGSGEPVQGLVFDTERQADMYNGNRKPGMQAVFASSRMTDPSGHARLLLPVGTYALVVRDSTTKGGTRWELPERRISVRPGGPAARVQLRATRMRARTLIPVQDVDPQ
jgi:hypothetical protein